MAFVVIVVIWGVPEFAFVVGVGLVAFAFSLNAL